MAWTDYLPATRGALKHLDEKIDRVASEMTRRFNDTMSKADGLEIKNEIRRMAAILESYAVKTEDNRNTLTVYDRILKDHRLLLKDHGVRLDNIEGKA